MPENVYEFIVKLFQLIYSFLKTQSLLESLSGVIEYFGRKFRCKSISEDYVTNKSKQYVVHY